MAMISASKYCYFMNCHLISVLLLQTDCYHVDTYQMFIKCFVISYAIRCMNGHDFCV